MIIRKLQGFHISTLLGHIIFLFPSVLSLGTLVKKKVFEDPFGFPEIP